MAIVIANTRYMIIYVIVLSVLDLASAAAGSDVTTRHKQQQVSGRQGHQELYCPPCQEVSCPIKRTHALKCRGGMTLGICNCCTVCAKLEDETCGGPWDYLGKCDMGLYCDTTGHVTGDRTGTSEGVCRKKGEFTCRHLLLWTTGHCTDSSPTIVTSNSLICVELAMFV